MNLRYNICKQGLCALFLSATLCSSLSAQELRTSYFMGSTTTRSLMNPAFQPERGYVSIPALGGINASYGTNGVAVDNFIYPLGNKTVTFLDPSVNTEAFLNGLNDENQVNMDLGVQVLSAGWYAGKGFWNVDISVKSLANVRVPKTLFEFMKRGNGSQNTYDIRNIQAYAEAYIETGVGYSRPINDKLTVGGKLNLLWGVGSINGQIDRMYAEMDENQWKVTSTGTVQANMKGLVPEMKQDAEGREYYDSFDFDSPGLSGFGFGVDLGATYQLTDDITLSAAVLDLGFMSWNKSGSTVGHLDGTVDFDGFDIAFGDNPNNIPSVGDQFDQIKDDFEDLIHLKEGEAKGSTTRLRSTLNIGGEYRMFDKKLGFGLLSTTRFYSPKAYTELTLSANYRPVKWFEVTASYSFIHSKFKTYGFALNFSPKFINFFIGSDYMFTKVTPQFLPVSANAMNLHLGISVPLRSVAKN